MLGWWFSSDCPCDIESKRWVERRLGWLEEEFDDHAFNGRRIVLPTREFFPDPYDGSDESVQRLLERVCGYMDVPAEQVDLEFINESDRPSMVNRAGEHLPDAAGTYRQQGGRHQIQLEVSGLDDPMSLVGTMAHELSHARLLGEWRVSPTAYDGELLTDLTVVFFGLGIFLANSPRSYVSHMSRWPRSKLRKPEYMTSPMFGYALAHLAWFRGERRPSWAKCLNMAARAEFKQALRFLFKTGDSAFKPVGLHEAS